MRVSLLCLICLMALGCYLLQPDQAKASISPIVQHHSVSIGDRLIDAERIIHESGAREFVPGSFSAPPFTSNYFVLKDGTCLCVTSKQFDEGGDYLVVNLTLGEPGRGYVGKKSWMFEQQRREVKSIELP